MKAGVCYHRQANLTAKPFAINKKGVTRVHNDEVVRYTIIEVKNFEIVKTMLLDNPSLDEPKNSIEILESVQS